MGNFVNLSRSGNKLTIEESNHDRDPSRERKSFLQKIFAGRKETTTLNTQFKVASDKLNRETIKPVHYDPFLDELLLPELDPNIARFKQFKAL